MESSNPEIIKVIQEFPFEGKLVDIKTNKVGLINDTYIVTFENGKEEKYILQRVSRKIFTEPEKLMENIVKVTYHIKEKIKSEGGDPEREVINVIKTKTGEYFYEEENGDFWRVYIFIEDTLCFDKSENPETFFETGLSFGKFHSYLADFEAEILHESIKDFHNTEYRFDNFLNALEKDIKGRRKNIKEEEIFVVEREGLSTIFNTMIDSDMIPFRVTHNDTKINNILMDKDSNKGVCVVDLDTLMPGIIMNDFGDAIRSGANTTYEDDPNLENVSLDLELFEAFTKGFIEGTNGNITKKEIELLPLGAKVMTYECGMRFLTDYLEGDNYWKTTRENHNLDRARNQFKLLKDMEEKSPQMEEIVNKYI